MRKAMLVLTAVLVSVSMLGVADAQDSARSAKRAPVSFHQASMTSVQGYKEMALDRDQKIYVSPKAALSLGDVASSEMVETRDGVDMLLTVNEKSAVRFGKLLRSRSADRMAIMAGGRLIGAGSVSFSADDHVATITGLSTTQAERISEAVGGESAVPVGSQITVAASRQTLMPGQSTTLDVFISGVPNLRVYQVALSVAGGSSGSLTVSSPRIERDRTDYVFGSLQKLDAVDEVGNRIGGLLMDGGVDATDPLYLGSYTVTASPDASGTFRINLRTDDTEIRDSASMEIRYGAGPGAKITVGASPRTTDK
jgi:hypothetical protein